MGLLNTLKRIITGPQLQPLPELGRNDRCWCGSGRKYKTCHLTTDSRRRSAERATAGPAGSNLSRGF